MTSKKSGVNADELFAGTDDSQFGPSDQELEENKQQEAEQATEQVTEQAIEQTIEPEGTEEKAEPKEAPTASITDILGVDTDESEASEEAHGESSGKVSLKDHIKLRKRTQAAEARANAAEEQLKLNESQPPTGATIPGIEIGEDDVVTGRDLKAIAAQIKKEAKVEARAEVEADRAKLAIKTKLADAIASQDALSAQYDNYYDVIERMSMINLTDSVKKGIANSDDPAKAAYDVGCKLLNVKPVPAKNVQTTTPETKETNNNAKGEGFSQDDFNDLFG